MCKRLAWFSKEDRIQRTVLLDVDKAGSSSKECANAITHSLKKLLGVDSPNIKFAGQMTDSGGGMLESVAAELKKAGITNPDVYNVGSCTLHLLQLAISNPVKKVFGNSGRGSLNLIQLLFSC